MLCNVFIRVFNDLVFKGIVRTYVGTMKSIAFKILKVSQNREELFHGVNRSEIRNAELLQMHHLVFAYKRKEWVFTNKIVYQSKIPGCVSSRSALQLHFTSKPWKTAVCTAVGYLLPC